MNELYEGIAVGKEHEQLVEVSGRSEIHKNKKRIMTTLMWNWD